MGLRLFRASWPVLLLLSLVVCYDVGAEEEDLSVRIMEDFSGYPIRESRSELSLSVDSVTLQKQVDELATFSDTPAPSVTRILYSENDVELCTCKVPHRLGEG